jgi:hypothetical protein
MVFTSNHCTISGMGQRLHVKRIPCSVFKFRKAYPSYTFRFESYRNKSQGFLFLNSPVYEESSCLH